MQTKHQTPPTFSPESDKAAIDALGRRLLTLAGLLSLLFGVLGNVGVRVIWPAETTSVQGAEVRALRDSVAALSKHIEGVQADVARSASEASATRKLVCQLLARVNPRGAITPSECTP